MRVAAPDEQIPEPMAYDGIVVRSYIPDSLRARLRPYVSAPGPLGALTSVIPDLANILDSGAQQVFGMIFDTELKCSELKRDAEIAFVSRTEIEINGRVGAQLRVHLTAAAAKSVASRMSGIPEVNLNDVNSASTAQELGKLLMARIAARCRDRSLDLQSGMPVLEPAGRPKRDESLIYAYSLPNGSDAYVSLVAIDRREAGGEPMPQVTNAI